MAQTQVATTKRKRRAPGEGMIRQLPNGRWEARITVDYQPKSYYGGTRSEVVAKLNAAKRDLADGLTLADDRQTVETWLRAWLKTLSSPPLAQTTIKRHEEYVRLHIVPALGRHRLGKLAPAHVHAFYRLLLEEKRLSPTTVNHCHATLHKALDAAVRFDAIRRNVTELVDAPSPAGTEMTPLSAEEAQILLDTAAAHGDRFIALWTLALSTGMRQGELLALRWRDVDLDGGWLSVRTSLTRDKKARRWVFRIPKTKKSVRDIALSAQAVDALRAHRAQQNEERLQLGEQWADLGLVFCTHGGGPLAGGNVLREFKKALARAGLLPAVRFHDLRHTAATLALDATHDLKAVSDMLGHASVAITGDIYAHATERMRRGVSDALAAALAGGGTR